MKMKRLILVLAAVLAVAPLAQTQAAADHLYKRVTKR